MDRRACEDDRLKVETAKAQPSLDPQAIRDYCFGLLARRDYSRHELLQKALVRFKLPKKEASLISAQLDYLAEKNYQSDERFAVAFARSKANSGQGRARIRQALALKGITEAMAEAAIAGLGAADNYGAALLGYSETMDQDQPEINAQWLERAYQTWLKKFKYYSAEPKDIAKQKRFLLYRGYSFDEIAKVLERAAKESVGE